MAVWDSEKRRTFINKALVAKLASMIASKRESKHVYDYMSVLRSIYTVKKKKKSLDKEGPYKKCQEDNCKRAWYTWHLHWRQCVIEKQSSAQ